MRIAGVALVFSAVALGVALFALRQESPRSQRAPARNDRVEALETQVAELTREVAALKAGSPEQARSGAAGLPFVPPGTEAGGSASPANVAGGAPEIEAIVEDAVERRTERVLDEMAIKANKKPAMEVFASMLELSREQRAQTERVVLEGQQEIHGILATPTSDGTSLMDQIVEIAARGLAEPGKDHGFGRWVARVFSEKVPGTDETYGARIESVKNAMRATLRREWSEAQYREFEAWGVDPSEIEKVPGSPNEALGKRIAERARALGAALPGG